MANLPYVVPYDPDFLGDGFRVPLPAANCPGNLYECGRIFDYIHFSLVLHQNRRMALYTAHNIDVSQRKSVPTTGWDLDPRIDVAAQTGPGAYHNNPWDRGHLVRRAAVAWGTSDEAKASSDSTYFYTNASPQHQKFNQDEWLNLEDWVLNTAGDISSKLCVFTGPIYTKIDTFFEETRIPSAFWKVVVLRDPTADGNDLAALGFVMKQNEMWDDWNGASTLNLRLYQVGIPEIGGYTGIQFGDLAMLDEFEWRQARFRDRTKMRPIEINGPEDIEFFGHRRRARGLYVRRVGPPEQEVKVAATPKPCGCGEAKAANDERYAALVSQVQAMREVLDALLEEKPKSEAPERVALERARENFARIVGGEQTELTEFPDCACIGSGEGNNEFWFCSGVLIAPGVVLTAAHCAPEIDKVYLGGRSLNLIGMIGEVVKVDRAIIHPDYDPHRIPSHDIAVLLLEEDAQTAPVQLASSADVNAEDNVQLVGFGYDDPNLPLGFGTKRKVDVELTSLQGVPEDVSSELQFIHGFDASFEFHAGSKGLGKDSCNGDSGGPAYIRKSDGSVLLAGLTSRAAFSSVENCGDGGIYTRVAPYLDWLRNVSGDLLAIDDGDQGEDNDTSAGNPTSGASGSLYISAAMPNPAGVDQGNEWVELTNPAAADVNLNDYRLEDKQGGAEALSGVLSSGGTRRIVLPSSSPVKLGNSGDDIILKKAEETVHHVTYTSAGSGEILSFEQPSDTGTGTGGSGGGDTGSGGSGGCGTPPGQPPLLEADPC